MITYDIKNKDGVLIINIKGKATGLIRETDNVLKDLFEEIKLRNSELTKVIVNLNDENFIANNSSSIVEYIVKSILGEIDSVNEELESKNISPVIVCNDNDKNIAFERLGLDTLYVFTYTLEDALNL